MSMDTNHGNDFNKNTTDRNMNDKSVTAFLLSPRYRIYRHLLLQLVVVLITINVLWYEPLQTVSFGRRLGGCLAYFASMNMVIYINLYVLVPYFLLKNRWGSYVLMAVITNIAVITFLSVTQGLLFEVILDAKKLLMERNHMSEEEAHRYMQKCSMDSGNNMVETAKMIFALMKY